MAANTANTTTSTAPASDEAAINIHEVGMMFVHEYYTFLNKEPSRLHCFYNKQSTMSHGIQGEETQICHGQQASAVMGLMAVAVLISIHAKILDLDFEDCKVLVRNVDSQSSLNGGIMIQVLGEMSNKGGPSQKFVQTFFLAVQPKGYFVLNDILRYLKDEEVEVEEYETELLPETENEAEAVIVVDVPLEVAVEAALEVAVEAVVEEVAPVIEALAVEVVKPVEATKVENVEEKKPATEEKKSTDKKADHKRHDKKSEKKEKDSKKDARKEIERVEKSHPPEPSSKKQAESAEVTQDQTASTPTPAAAETVAAPAPAPAEPPKPSTWASTAARNSNQWGTHASSAKAVSVNVPQATPKPQPQGQPQGQSKFQERRPNGREEYYSIFIKNVTERMTADQLREAFATFGPIKNLELVHKRYCAYIDFGTAEAMQAALKQNKVNVGSETVLAEERRRPGPQSGNRPFHYQNTAGGSSGHQGPQGGHRGGRSSRGGFQDRKPIQRPDKAAPTVAVN
ncbi:hypothetical protein BGZ51_004135 [Haplosporangium sp. Z 767]|nr:hypothetical protein BGZ50_000707 [Haplosporangium sp. Z 11]KAF9193163.1 hypothetical protein BGZ51_004135 [Haplosporangium sp. Z 767]